MVNWKFLNEKIEIFRKFVLKNQNFRNLPEKIEILFGKLP